jgi:hypothetical protein
LPSETTTDPEEYGILPFQIKERFASSSVSSTADVATMGEHEKYAGVTDVVRHNPFVQLIWHAEKLPHSTEETAISVIVKNTVVVLRSRRRLEKTPTLSHKSYMINPGAFASEKLNEVLFICVQWRE